MPSLGERLKTVYRSVQDFLWNVDKGTWVSHLLQGVAVAAVFDLRGFDGEAPFLALLYHGGARELPGIKSAAEAGDTADVVDGVLDYMSFFVGMGLYYLLRGPDAATV